MATAASSHSKRRAASDSTHEPSVPAGDAVASPDNPAAVVPAKSASASTPAERSSLTPAMRQYLEQKEQVGDALLLFRMGDFYETFYDDAKTIARVLGLTLTARNRDSADPIPLAGVPYHAVDGYVARLVRAGFKVALSEQMEDPKTAKGVVKRAVCRIITPGTLTEDALLDERADNYLAAVYPSGGRWPEGGARGATVGLACVELASGRFFAEMVRAESLGDDLARLRPAELIVPEQAIDAGDALPARLAATLEIPVTARPGHRFDAHLAERTLHEQFGVTSLAGFGFERMDASLCAAAAVVDYLRETQKSTLVHIQRIAPRQSAACVVIDPVTQRALEIERSIRDGARDGSLLGTIDQTVNPMGARRLRDWLCYPLRDGPAIRARQTAIEAFRQQPARLTKVRALLKDMGDVERIAARVGVGRASPRDLVGLGRAARRCADLAETLGPAEAGGVAEKGDATGKDPATDLISRCVDDLGGLDALGDLLMRALREDAAPTLRDGGFIADGFDAELDRLRNIGEDGQRWLAEYQAREAARSGISTLKVGYNSVFGFYIEITNTHRDKVPPDYVRKQTVRNAERYITDELKRHEQDVLGAADRAKQRELGLFEQLRTKTLDYLAKLQKMAEAVATLDVLAALAELSRSRDYVRPELVEAADGGAVLEILDGRHPVLDVTLAERFVPNDCRLSAPGERLAVITGPNMAGKSTYIRQAALLVLLAQTGSFVPAKAMRWSGVDRIFARVGASDELARGQSTFMVEMVEAARILNQATASSLVILDEIGRGTSTYDGLAIAWAIAEFLVVRVGCRALFATHYHELTELARELAGVTNLNVAVQEQLRPSGAGRDVVFLHRIVPGAADRSYGVHVAGMAGLPRSVVKRAETLLGQLERKFAKAHEARRDVLRGKAHDDQPLLFGDVEPPPAWVRPVGDLLDAADVNHLTPMAALEMVQELKGLIEHHKEGEA